MSLGVPFEPSLQALEMPTLGCDSHPRWVPDQPLRGFFSPGVSAALRELLAVGCRKQNESPRHARPLFIKCLIVGSSCKALLQSCGEKDMQILC